MQNESYELTPINRSALMLEPRENFLEWVNGYPGDDLELTLDELQEDNTLFLIPEQDAKPNAWLKHNYKAMFESELES